MSLNEFPGGPCAEPNLHRLGMFQYVDAIPIREIETPWWTTDLGDDTSLPWNLNAF